MYIQISKDAAEMVVSLLQDRQQALKEEAFSVHVAPDSTIWDEYYNARELEVRLLDLITSERYGDEEDPRC